MGVLYSMCGMSFQRRLYSEAAYCWRFVLELLFYNFVEFPLRAMKRVKARTENENPKSRGDVVVSAKPFAVRLQPPALSGQAPILALPRPNTNWGK